MIKNIFGAKKLTGILDTFTKVQDDLIGFINGNGDEIKVLQSELATANAEQVQAQQALNQINKIVGSK